MYICSPHPPSPRRREATAGLSPAARALMMSTYNISIIMIHLSYIYSYCNICSYCSIMITIAYLQLLLCIYDNDTTNNHIDVDINLSLIMIILMLIIRHN